MVDFFQEKSLVIVKIVSNEESCVVDGYGTACLRRQQNEQMKDIPRLCKSLLLQKGKKLFLR